MKIGVALNMPADSPRPDAEILREQLALGDLAEPCGFDSLFVLEHHFTDYVLSPDPLQLLTYFAGRTRAIELGTAVIVLPFHHPIRLAEQISLLDSIAPGRCTFAFGRGSADVEYRGFGLTARDSTERFAEGADCVLGLLSQPKFSYTGKHFTVPPVSIRPRPSSAAHRRFLGAARLPASIELIAKLGFGLLVSTQKSWTDLAEDIRLHQLVALRAGHQPIPPTVLAMISIDRSADRAASCAAEYLQRDLALVHDHYGLPAAFVDVSRLIAGQIVGTPAECVDQIADLQSLTGCGQLLLEFSYGRMPAHLAAEGLQLFAREALPELRQLVPAAASLPGPLVKGDS